MFNKKGDARIESNITLKANYKLSLTELVSDNDLLIK